MKKKISVIIPVYNEEKMIGSLLDQLNTSTTDFEIIVVDGCSTDNTPKVVSANSGVIYLTSPCGRAVQMNAGASKANGELLWFLHADSRICKRSGELIEATLQEDVVAGSFYLKFDRNNFWLNFYSRVSKSNLSVFTYGDQGIFVKKQVFEKLGGFRNIPIMEDLDFVRKVKKTGKFSKLDYPVVTSARRFEESGFVWQEIKNAILVMGYCLGVSTNFLARFYKY